MSTWTHIRCGDDLREALAVACIPGPYVAFTDPICRGPVPDDGDLDSVRAAFIASSYGGSHATVVADLRAASAALDAAIAAGSVALWFEHDSYDQLILARVLHRLHFLGSLDGALICIDRHPNHRRFVGLGQLDPAEIRALWPTRTPLHRGLLQLGARVWIALRATDPRGLAALAATETPDLPMMAPALRRHLRELPWSDDGLGLTQRLILRALADGPLSAGAVFRRLHLELEPLPFLGDLMLWADVCDLAGWQRPPLAVAGGGAWPDRTVTLTAVGEAILGGRSDARDLGSSERWVGGVRLAENGPWWRWDEAAEAVTEA